MGRIYWLKKQQQSGRDAMKSLLTEGLYKLSAAMPISLTVTIL